MRNHALCRLSGRVGKLPKITVLGEENPALTHRHLDDGVIFCGRGNHGPTRKSPLSSARKRIHAFGHLIEVFYPLPLSSWNSKVTSPSNAGRAPSNAARKGRCLHLGHS
jgi:hypothetical protein